MQPWTLAFLSPASSRSGLFRVAHIKMDRMTWLSLKSGLIGSRWEPAAKHLRWMANAPQRVKHPELWELYLEDIWLPQVLQRLLKPDTSVVDVGAHLGSFLAAVLRLAPRGIHVAIEPSRSRSAMLTRKFPKIRVLPVALSDENGIAAFLEDPGRPGYSRLEGGIVQRNVVRYDVTTRTLDHLFLGDPIGLIKLDIEGGELAALRGGEQLIRQRQPAIIFECGHEYPPQKTDRAGTFKFLVDLGYEVYTFGDFLYGKGPLSADEFRKCAIYPFRAFNYVAIPRPAGTMASTRLPDVPGEFTIPPHNVTDADDDRMI